MITRFLTNKHSFSSPHLAAFVKAQHLGHGRPCPWMAKFCWNMYGTNVLLWKMVKSCEIYKEKHIFFLENTKGFSVCYGFPEINPSCPPNMMMFTVLKSEIEQGHWKLKMLMGSVILYEMRTYSQWLSWEVSSFMNMIYMSSCLKTMLIGKIALSSAFFLGTVNMFDFGFQQRWSTLL